ncbi:MAG: WcbI family polysaccharide biosynthesis putative acetyltransferase [Pseudomonadota bacterium]
MSRTIFVVGNCQIGGIAAALQWLFPNDSVSPVPYNPHAFKGNTDALVGKIGTADIVLGGEFVNAFLRQKKVGVDNFITIPGLYFSAFHPDIVAAKAKIKATGGRYQSPYNSAIILWAYANSIEPADAVRLFSRKTFKALGYLDRWDASVARMKGAFDTAGLDFDRFFCAAKRDGVFMHTNNHPKARLLTWAAKLLAQRMGADQSVWRKEIQINDALSRVAMWPVYPDIAYEFALPGSYTWFVDRGAIVDGLREYVEYAYENYAKSGVAPADMQMVGVNQDAYQSVLSAALKGA